MAIKIDDLNIYEIYPTSFYDSNGDGIGDLNGIIEKLDYVKDLGVNSIWFNPFYKSEFADGGYDVVDYYKVDERFGTNEDFVRLAAECKKRGLKVIVDMVIGHTSEKCPWFLDSCKAERNAHSDWYVWTTDIFATDDRCIANPKERDGCYRINYYITQPALNFGFDRVDENKPWQWHYTDPRLKPLRDELIKMMKFWCALGADGFRCDMALSLVKNLSSYAPIAWVWERLIGGVREEYPHTLFFAEWGNPAVSVGESFFDLDYLTHEIPQYNQLIRNEKGMNIAPYYERGYNYFSEEGKGEIQSFLEYFYQTEEKIKGKGAYVFDSGNHDLVRISEGKSERLLKVIYAFMYTWKTVPMLYYGDEIGMKYRRGIHKDGGSTRTGARTPMQWTDGKNRGFSTAAAKDLYLPVDENSESVQSQKARADSLYHTVKKLIGLHKLFPYSAAVRVKEAGYPFVYERIAVDGVYTVFLQPAAKKAAYEVAYDQVIDCENCAVSGGTIETDGVGYAIVFKKA